LAIATPKVPPSREHAEDIPAIVAHFLEGFCRENGLAELRFAAATLSAHAWQGNARELRNVVQRCATEAENSLISKQDVREHFPL